MLQRSVEKEVGIVEESDVLGLLERGTLEDAQLDDGWRIDGAAISRGCN